MYLDFRLLLKISHTNRLCACYIKLFFSPMWIMVIQGVEVEKTFDFSPNNIFKVYGAN